MNAPAPSWTIPGMCGLRRSGDGEPDGDALFETGHLAMPSLSFCGSGDSYNSPFIDCVVIVWSI